MIAAATLRFLDPFGTGKLVLFQVTYDKVSAFKIVKVRVADLTTQDWHAFELWFFLILGLFGVSRASLYERGRD